MTTAAPAPAPDTDPDTEAAIRRVGRLAILNDLAERDPALGALMAEQFAMLDELVQFARDAGAALERVASIKMPPGLAKLFGGQ